jgi:hypothetical protein
MACHSEGATRSKSKSNYIKVKGDVPKAKATEESPVQYFNLTQQKNRPLPVETKDSSSADYYLPSKKVRGWPPQNDKS